MNETYMCGYIDGKSDALDEIMAEIKELKIEDNSNNICFKVHNNVVEGILRIIELKSRK